MGTGREVGLRLDLNPEKKNYMKVGTIYETTIWGVPFKFPHVEPTRLGPHFHVPQCQYILKVDYYMPITLWDYVL